MSYKVDFHIHTYYSDGIMKPTDIVKMYHEKEYDIIAITDHDGVDGVKEAEIAGEALNLKVIPGIEFSTCHDFDGKKIELHILGYYIDIENEQLRDRLKSIRADRQDRNERLIKKLNDMGYELSFDDLMERQGQTYIGKPNFARALVRKGYTLDNQWEVFDTVKKEKITTAEAIKLIKDAGGIPVLAHPLKTKGLGDVNEYIFFITFDKLLKELKQEGLKGLECFHPSANEEQALKLVDLAGKYHFHITEGTDFHQ